MFTEIIGIQIRKRFFIPLLLMKCIPLMILLFPSFCMAQKGYFFGIHGNTGLYWLYNYNDFHSTNEVIKPDPAKFQDYQSGFRFEYGLSQRARLSFDLNFQNFRQGYRQDMSSGTGIYWRTLSSKLNYVSLTCGYLINLVNPNKSKVVPYFKGGFHLAYLTHFLEQVEQILPSFHYLGTNDNGIITNYTKFINTGVEQIGHSISDPIYHKLIYGLNTEFGVNFSITPKLSLGIEMCGLYSLRNVDNLKSEKTGPGFKENSWLWGTKLSSNQDLSERKPSHNIYLGLGLSFTYFLPDKKNGDLPCPPKR